MCETVLIEKKGEERFCALLCAVRVIKRIKYNLELVSNHEVFNFFI